MKHALLLFLLLTVLPAAWERSLTEPSGWERRNCSLRSTPPPGFNQPALRVTPLAAVSNRK